MQNPPNATLINLVKQEQILCLPSGQSTPAPATATYVPGQASTAIPTPSGIAGSGGGAAASSGGAAASSHAAAGASSGGAGAASPSPSAAAVSLTGSPSVTELTAVRNPATPAQSSESASLRSVPSSPAPQCCSFEKNVAWRRRSDRGRTLAAAQK